MKSITDLVDLFDSTLEGIETMENDGRHGIGEPWVVVRGRTRSVPKPRPGTVYIGERRKPHIRRLYVHPSGFIAEGGRGGARIFYVDLDAPPHPFISPIESPVTMIRARSMKLAAAIVEVLAAHKVGP